MQRSVSLQMGDKTGSWFWFKESSTVMKAMERETFKKKNCRRHVKTQLNNCGSRSRNRRDTLLTFPECGGREGNKRLPKTANGALGKTFASVGPRVAHPWQTGSSRPELHFQVSASILRRALFFSVTYWGMRMGEADFFSLHVTSDD